MDASPMISFKGRLAWFGRLDQHLVWVNSLQRDDASWIFRKGYRG